MLFRAFLLTAALTAAAPITAQVIEDISMLTVPGSTESEPLALVLPTLYSLNPMSLVLVTWRDGTTSLETVSQLILWYEER